MYKNLILSMLLKRGPLATKQIRAIVVYNVKREDAFKEEVLEWLKKQGLIGSTGFLWKKRWHITRRGRLWLQDFGN